MPASPGDLLNLRDIEQVLGAYRGLVLRRIPMGEDMVNIQESQKADGLPVALPVARIGRPVQAQEECGTAL